MAKLEKQSASPPPGLVKHDVQGLGTLDVSSYDTHGTATATDDEMYWGDGNKPTNYNIAFDSKAGIELGLKIHYRTGSDILPTSVGADGTAYYTAPDGPQVVDTAHEVYTAAANRSAWNFDFSVNTGVGGGGKTADDFNLRIVISDNDGNTHAYTRTHTVGGVVWANAETATGFGEVAAPTTQLAQDSVNMAFLQTAFGADFQSAGEQYDITLQAFDDKGKIVAQVHDVIFLA